MRELKFRAWDERWEFMTAKVSFEDLQNGFVGLYGEDNIVMQYTGLKDKNGKEIFEGDILTHNSGKFLIKIDCYGVNFLGDGNEQYSNRFDDETLFYNEYEWEIIGNIYENPELLEVAHER